MQAGRARRVYGSPELAGREPQELQSPSGLSCATGSQAQCSKLSYQAVPCFAQLWKRGCPPHLPARWGQLPLTLRVPQERGWEQGGQRA